MNSLRIYNKTRLNQKKNANNTIQNFIFDINIKIYIGFPYKF